MLYIEELTQGTPEGTMVSVPLTDFVRDTRLARETIIRSAKRAEMMGFLSCEGSIGTTNRYALTLGGTSGNTRTGDVELQPSVSDDDTPEYYTILSSMDGRIPPLAPCEKWREKKGYDLDRMENAALAMKSKLNYDAEGKRWMYVDYKGTKRYYTDMWAVCRVWATRGERLRGGARAGDDPEAILRDMQEWGSSE